MQLPKKWIKNNCFFVKCFYTSQDVYPEPSHIQYSSVRLSNTGLFAQTTCGLVVSASFSPEEGFKKPKKYENRFDFNCAQA